MFFLLGISILAPSKVIAATYYGTVVAVADGDTVTVLDEQRQRHKIRLAGIDAPERKQPYGQKAKQHLAEAIYEKQVALECSKVDKYRRAVCKITLDGTDINLMQIKSGMAWWYRKYSKEQAVLDRIAYETEESEARNNMRGLWLEPSPVPPWEWRKTKKIAGTR